MKIPRCGDGSDRLQAGWHAGFAVLYLGALAFHLMSALRHWGERK